MGYKKRTNLTIQNNAVVIIGNIDINQTLEQINNHFIELNHYRYNTDVYLFITKKITIQPYLDKYKFVKSVKFINAIDLDTNIEAKAYLTNYAFSIIRNSDIKYDNVLFTSNSNIFYSEYTLDECFDISKFNLDVNNFNIAFGRYNVMSMFMTFYIKYAKMKSKKTIPEELTSYLKANKIIFKITTDISKASISTIENIGFKVDLSNKSVYCIIPFRGSKLRNSNMVKFIEYINNIFDNINIIVAEHDTESKIDFSGYNNITHYFLKCNDGELFDRTGILNYLIKKCPNDSIIINNDNDCIVSQYAYNNAIDMIHSGKYDYIVPYNGVGYNVKNDFSFNRKLTTKEIIPRWSCTAGGIIIFKKDMYSSIGYENENIISWGYEDFERFYRTRIMVGDSRMISPVPMFNNAPKTFVGNNKTFLNESLYHFDHNAERDESSSGNPHKNHNRNIAEMVMGMNKKLLAVYIDTFSWKKKPSVYDNYEICKTKTYSNYLKGKRVCLVGPAPHLIDSNQRNHIEGFDVIVRLNVALPIIPIRYKDIGCRTDILYNCLSESKENGGKIDFKYLKSEINWLVSPYPKHGVFKKQIESYEAKNKKSGFVLNTSFVNTQRYLKLEKDLGCRPNTGFSAIMDLLSYDIKELYVTGITFFQGGYDPSYRPSIDGIEIKDAKHSEQIVLDRMDKAGAHKQQPQIDYLKQIYKDEPRLKGDSKFITIVSKTKL